jgi:hypothetical protein
VTTTSSCSARSARSARIAIKASGPSTSAATAWPRATTACRSIRPTRSTSSAKAGAQMDKGRGSLPAFALFGSRPVEFAAGARSTLYCSHTVVDARGMSSRLELIAI